VELIPSNTNIDFIGQTRLCVSISVAACVLALALMLFKGFNLGVDFAGGTVLQIQVPEEAGPVDEGRVREALSALGRPDASVVRYGAAAERGYLITVRDSLESNKALESQIVEGLTAQLGAPVVRQRIESIGPRVGAELARAAIAGLGVSFLLILIYVWFRFDLRFAPGAVVALVHDTLLTAGVFVALGLEFDLNVIAALLVIVGYSLNDTIVIYDRIRELLELRGTTRLEEVVNKSLNQTLSRTILTSGVTLLTVIALLVFGGPVLFGFALALLIGMLAGVYSTVYVASAMFIWLERRYPRPQTA
jgi:preprotein translocase subunit SecF